VHPVYLVAEAGKKAEIRGDLIRDLPKLQKEFKIRRSAKDRRVFVCEMGKEYCWGEPKIDSFLIGSGERKISD
jgi:hypothetical protein